MSGSKKRLLLQPGSIRGIRPDAARLALPEGIVGSSSNIRINGDGIARSRYGAKSVLSQVLASSSYRGSIDATFEGIHTLFVALENTGVIRVYKSTDAGTSFTEITASSGAYGNTRFPDNGTPIYMQVVRDSGMLTQGEQDALIMQDGVSSPRVYQKSGGATIGGFGTGYGTSIILQPSQPEDVRARGYFPNQFDIQSGTAASWVNSDAAKMAGSTIGAVSSRYLQLDVKTTATTAQTSEVALASPTYGLDPSAHGGSPQLVMFLSTETGKDIANWQSLKLDLYDGTNWVTAWPGYATALTVDTGKTAGLAGATNIQQIHIEMPSGITAAVQKLRFTGPATSFASNQKFYLWALCGSGTLDPATRFAIAFGGSDTRSLGISGYQTGEPIGYASPVTPAYAPLSDAVMVQMVAGGLYSFSVDCKQQTNADLAAGVDYAYLYRQDAEQSQPYLVDRQKIAAYAAGWARVNVNVTTQRVNPFVFPYAVQDGIRQAPDGGSIVMPIATAMASANLRTFVAATSRLYFSESGQPFAFRKAVRALPYTTQADPYSGSSTGFDGETIMAIVPTGSGAMTTDDFGSIVGRAGSILIMTATKLYEISGYDAETLSVNQFKALHGTRSPFSVARSQYYTYWLGHDGQVVRYGPDGTQLIGLFKVTSKTQKIPGSRQIWARGASRDNRYFLAYSEAGGTTNAQALVWSEYLGEWETVDAFPSGMTGEGLHTIQDGGYVKLIAVSSTTAIHEHDVPQRVGDLSGSYVTAAIDFPDLAGDLVHRVCVGQFFAIADTTGTMQVTITPSTGENGGTPLVTTIDLGAISTDTIARALSADAFGDESLTFSASVTATIPGGNRIYAIGCEFYETLNEDLYLP